MICESLDYYNFRNIETAHIDLCPGINVLYGENAEGKTNAIEGIYLFAGGRSFRAHSDAEMIRFGENTGGIRLRYSDRVGTGTLEFAVLPSGRRSCKKNGCAVSRLSEFVGCFHAVLFCPEHLAIVKDGPAVRRSFLDMALSQLSPVYLSSLQRYHVLLRQRNALLKKRLFSGRGPDSEFADSIYVWSAQLAHEAAYISLARSEYVERLCGKARALLSDMSGGREEIAMSYTGPQDEAWFLEKLTGSLEREIKLGGTIGGIHRDDMGIRIGGREARSFASQGQQRSAALCIKLGEGEIICDEVGEQPVYLLDDILSELDEGRRRYILSGIRRGQVIITSCSADVGGDRRFLVRGGTYTPQ